jgi:two-component system response regulator YesN
LSEMTVLFENGQLNIKHALIIYNHVMSFLYRLEGNHYEEYVYTFRKLTEMFDSVKEMLLYLKEVLVEKMSKHNDVDLPRIKNQTLKAIFMFINDNFCNDISVQSISADFHVNPNYFCQLFKKEVGVTFTEYLTNLRIDYACKLLTTTDIPINEIAGKVGYDDYFYFSRVFKKIKGKSPSSYRMEGEI